MSSTDDLFRSPPAYLPRIRDGETLFSWGGRYHRLSGNPFARRSSLQLFGTGDAGLWFDFPSGLDQLQERTHRIVGTTEKLLERHTIFGLFSRFLTHEVSGRACEIMKGATRGPLKSLLGLLSCRAGATPPLRACRQCIATDLKDEGYAIWRLEHQWPMAWVCRKHGRPLGMIPKEFVARRMHLWPLPDDIATEAWRTPVIEEQQLPALSSLADWAEGIANLKEWHFDPVLLRYTYLAGAKRIGLTYPDGSLRQREVLNECRRRYSGLETLTGFGFVDFTNAPQGGFIGHLTRQYPGHRHPTKNILLMAILFESVKSFLETYSSKVELMRQEGPAAVVTELADGRARFRSLVEKQQYSVSRAAKEIGVSITQAVRWARTEGVSYRERPRVLTDEMEVRLRSLLESGMPWIEVTAQLGIKRSFVRSYLANHSVLREQWRQADFVRKRDAHRDRFTTILEENTGLPMKAIKRIPGNGFQWLERHDREWLLGHLPMLVRREPCPV